MTLSKFLERCDAYCVARGISRARLSTLLFNDGKKIAALHSGGDIGTRRLDRAVEALAEMEAPGVPVA